MLNMQAARYVIACLAMLIMPVSGMAQSEGIDVSPIRIILKAKQATSSLTITNKKRRPISFQVTTFKRSIVDGRESLTVTEDLIFNPPIFKLLPQQSQVIRVGMETDLGGATEKLYRILLEEIPLESPQVRAEVNVLMNLSIPIYVEPVGGPEPRLAFNGLDKTQRNPTLMISNTGNAHLIIQGLSLTNESKRKINSDLKSPIFLATGQSGTVPLKVPSDFALTGKFSVELDTSHGMKYEDITLQVP